VSSTTTRILIYYNTIPRGWRWDNNVLSVSKIIVCLRIVSNSRGTPPRSLLITDEGQQSRTRLIGCSRYVRYYPIVPFTLGILFCINVPIDAMYVQYTYYYTYTMTRVGSSDLTSGKLCQRVYLYRATDVSIVIWSLYNNIHCSSSWINTIRVPDMSMNERTHFNGNVLFLSKL